MELFKPAWKSKNEKRRYKWIKISANEKNIKHLELLVKMAKKDASVNNRIASIEKLDNEKFEKLFIDLARDKIENEDIRIASINKLDFNKWQIFLAELAKDLDEEEEIRVVAVNKLDSKKWQDLFTIIVQEQGSEYKNLRYTAVLKILTHNKKTPVSKIKDIDGISYNTLSIGKQEWFVENLNVSKFSNGDPILHARSEKAWYSAGKKSIPAWCFFENDPKNGKKYGKLYNWFAVADPRGLAPEGWHIPDNLDWLKLADYLGGYEIAGEFMKSSNGWKEGNGNNYSGFSGLPGGARYDTSIDICKFYSLGWLGYWWNSSEERDNKAGSVLLDYYSKELDFRHESHKECGFSVRCLKD